MGTRDQKMILRAACRETRGGIAGAERAAAELKILRLISDMISYRSAHTLFLYAPIGSEVNVFPLLEDAWRRGRRVALPRCTDQPGVMIFHLVTDPGGLLPGRFGVREPRADLPVIPANELSLRGNFLLAPGLAFDRKGYRLGYGKGYYDRFFAQFGGFCAGATFSALFLDELPHGRFDRRVDAVICERGVTLCRD